MEDAAPKEPASAGQIYLDIEDDITSIIGKVEGAAGEQVSLVVPKRATVLQSPVNMKLLKKAASAGRKRIALISEDPAVIKIAARLDMPVAATLKDEAKVPEVEEPTPTALPSEVIEGEEVSEATPAATAVTPPPAAKPAERGAAAVKAAAATAAIKKRIPDFDRFKKRFVLGILGAVGLIGLLWWMLIGVPKAKIIVEAETAPLGTVFDFTADTGAENPNFENDVVPAKAQTLDKTLTKNFTPTGKKDLGTKAKGSLTIKNCEDTNSHSFSSGTRFTSSSATGSKVFVADTGGEVPAGSFSGGGTICTTASTATVPVSALENGDSYNIAATSYSSSSLSGEFNIDGTAMSGGKSKVATVPTKADIDTAKNDLLGAEREGAKTALAAQFEEDEYKIDSSFAEKVESETSEPGVDAEATGPAKLTLKVKYSQLAVKRVHLVDLFKHNAEETADKQDKTDLGVVDEGLDEAEIVLKDKPAETASRFTAKTTALLGPDIDFEQLKIQLGGKRYGEAIATVKGFPNVTGADVKFSPFWVRKIPRNPDKVTIEIKLPQSR